MISDQERITIEKELGTLMGWKDIQIGGKRGLINIPSTMLTGTMDGSNDFVFMPAWARNWSSCGPLIAEHDLMIAQDNDSVTIFTFVRDRQECAVEQFASHPTKDDAVLYAIVSAVYSKLKHKKE